MINYKDCHGVVTAGQGDPVGDDQRVVLKFTGKWRKQFKQRTFVERCYQRLEARVGGEKLSAAGQNRADPLARRSTARERLGDLRCARQMRWRGAGSRQKLPNGESSARNLRESVARVYFYHFFVRCNAHHRCTYCNILKFYFYSHHKTLCSAAQVNQLKSAIQIHNDSIQFLKRQNAELRDELDEAKGKVSACKHRFFIFFNFFNFFHLVNSLSNITNVTPR